MNDIVLWRKCILGPVEGCEWASEMVLNPSLIEDPETKRLHMLVRVSGPMCEKKLEGKPMPFPIYFAYAYSDDGENFTFDLERPALSPAVKYTPEDLYITNGRGESVPNYANGCLEDPRTFFIEGECYCAIAARTFPPGPYWEHDVPTQCMPDWAKADNSPIGNQGNVTTTVLYKIDLKALAKRDYDNAFTYITDLTDPVMGEDRDVFIFPKKMMIDGKMQYVMVHRPQHPENYDCMSETRPSIVISAAEDLYSFAKRATKRRVLYAPDRPWQGNRVGASTPPIAMGDGRWLIGFHGKQDDEHGYGQSFMILKEVENDFPEIEYLYPEKWIVNEADFEIPRKFKIPCVFFTGIVKQGDRLLVSYGAADEFAAVMALDYNKTVQTLERYPYSK